MIEKGGSSTMYEDLSKEGTTVNIKERTVTDTPLEATKSEQIGLAGIKEDMEFPEGGLQAWLVVLGCWCGMTATFGVSNAIGAIQYELTIGPLKDYSESQISWIFSIWLWLCFFGGAQVGPIFDSYGVYVLIVPASIMFTASIMILSVCREYYQFILGFSILGGISCSMIFTPCVTAVGHFFKEKRAFATGLAASGGAIGGIMFPLTINKLVREVGYGWAIRIMGFIVMALLTICLLTIKDRHTEHKHTVKGAMIDFKSFKEIRYTFMVLGIFLTEWAIFVPLNYLKIYATNNGMSDNFGTNLLAYFNVGSVFGRSLAGLAGDKLGAFNTMIVTAGISGIACLAIWLPVGHTEAGLVSFAVVFGVFSGSTISLTPVCVSRISLTHEYGKRYGTCYTVVSFATLTGLPLSGALKAHNYLGMIIFCGVSYLAGSFAFFISRMVENKSIVKF